MGMEKGEKMDTSDTDSMTTVNVGINPMDYQEPPPAYRQVQNSTKVQIAKIIAVAAVIISAMLSISIVFSAWISAASCQQQQQGISSHLPVAESSFLRPQHLKGSLASSDLDLAESKVSNNQQNKIASLIKEKEKDASGEEKDSDNNSGEDDESVTMFKLPLELSFYEHMFEKKHRSHMNCVIEKKKAEEIVDEQSKPLPLILGINATTDPRYLHFTGEKMAISCDSGNDHKQIPMMPKMPLPLPVIPQEAQRVSRRPSNPLFPLPLPLGEIIGSALQQVAAAASNTPVHIIGPIPLIREREREQRRMPFAQPQIQNENIDIPLPPLQLIRQLLESQPQQFQQAQPSQNQPQIFFPPQIIDEQQQLEQQLVQESRNGPNSPMLPPHLVPIILQPEDMSNPSNNQERSFINIVPSSSEIRGERALLHPIPIMPRAHAQFHQVIRPRRSVDNLEEVRPEAKQRVKRCSCDCACKNHQE